MLSPTFPSSVNVSHPPAASKAWKAKYSTKNGATERTSQASPMQRVRTPYTLRLSTTPPPMHSAKEQVLPGQRSPLVGRFPTPPPMRSASEQILPGQQSPPLRRFPNPSPVQNAKEQVIPGQRSPMVGSFSTRAPPVPRSYEQPAPGERVLPPTARQVAGVNSPLPPTSSVMRQTSSTTPPLKSLQYVHNGESRNNLPSEVSTVLAAFPDDVDLPSQPDSQENASTSCDSGKQKLPKDSMMLSSISGVSTCAYRSGSSNGSSTDIKDSPSHSYTAEQWEAFHELEEAELRNEIRRLEAIVVEERSRGHLLQQTFADELMAQKDAHTRDITMLEDMLAKVMEENSNLSMMVRRLCAQVGKAQKNDATEPV